jgi:diguanylate cyclase (GGDEF)-like protein
VRILRLGKLKERLVISVPDSIRDELIHEIDRTNLIRSRIISLSLIIVEIAVMPFFLISKRGVFWADRDPLYIGVYTFLAVSMAVYFAASFFLEKHRQKAHRTILLYTCLLSATILAWCAAISLLDQLSSNQMIMYTAALFTVSVFPLLPHPVFFAVFFPVHILFLMLLPFFRSTPDLLFGTIVNTSVCAAVAAIISWALYRSKCRDIVNKYVIQEKNKELFEINEKLLSANKKLEGFSFTDSLTGLLNRRRLDERLSAEWERCKRSSMPLSLLILDVDCFKRINDIYGHQTGDLCLMLISDILNSSVKDHSDITARWGGEEFITALPFTDADKAFELAEHIRKQVEGMNDRNDGFGVKDKITVSIGVSAAVPSDRLTVKEMIEAADKALYKAKSKKGNRTEYAGVPVSSEYKKII